VTSDQRRLSGKIDFHVSSPSKAFSSEACPRT
jgi:hypothetical protein